MPPHKNAATGRRRRAWRILLASVVAGARWEAAGPAITFAAGAAFAGLADAALFVVKATMTQKS
ncbi:hypothetical protein [Rhizobium phaseoli]|uniref:hypothetical protein n=1 Tax=Rhizobium phaseoli TaxID=396 RepID=UPI000202C398|nr:hypothetical protein [Rhizobium phaseoli]EGE58857.1 hypothetical protein RHECNPAF_27006 [Rhizobium etli CNPAF512]MDH6645637.1 hypothetical protein [Rhizobium esperanzae]MDK4727648.1 hypothetical protein [Rhizobium phaseoli]